MKAPNTNRVKARISILKQNFRPALWISFWLAALALSAHAQKPSSGLLVSPDRYHSLPLLPSYSGVKYNEIPLSASLKKYCPVAGDQGGMSSCVGWAVGYSALTICQAIREEQNNQALITQMAHSSAFVYNQVKQEGKNCEQGAYIEDALSLLLEKGDCLEHTFNFQEADCNSLPNEAALQEASRYRILDFAAVFGQEDREKSKVAKACKILAAQKPLIVGLQVTQSFWEIRPGDKLWDPDEQEAPAGHHGLVLVGYDNVEKQFELMNSFGPGWGNNGFIKIGFEDFGRLCQYAYVLLLDAPAETDSKPLENRLENKGAAAGEIALGGEFVFRRPAGYLVQADGQEIPFFEEVPAFFQPDEGVYEPRQPFFEVGDAFQLVAREIPEGKFAYVFSKTPGGEAQLHFPKQDGAERTAGFVLSRNVEIVIPSEETVLQLSEPGVDYLCIVYSTAKIPDIASRLAALQYSNDFPEAVRQTFQDLLIPEENISRAPQKMAFEATATRGRGQIATAIILKVIAQ